MEFINQQGEPLQINPLDQQSIAAAKSAAPGEGVGLAVAGNLVRQIA